MSTTQAPVETGVRYRFGVFSFDADTLELVKSGRPIAVRPQPSKLLALLLAQPGELISREQLERALWAGDTFVDFEQGVNHAIRELRAALGDIAESPRFIQTLPRRGYRFIAPVERVGAAVPAVAEPPDSAVAPPTAIRPALTMLAGLGAIAAIIAVMTLVRLDQEPGLAAVPSTLVIAPF